MLREKIRQIIQEPKKAAIYVAVLSIIPFLHLFGLLLMLVVTLRKGAREGLLLAVIVSGCTLIISFLILHHTPEEIILQIANPFLLWGLAFVLYRSHSWEKVIQLLTGVGLLIVLGIGYFYPQVVAAWSKEWASNFALSMQQVTAAHPALMHKLSAAEWQQIITLMGALAPGFRPLLFVAAGLLSLVLARYIQASLYNPGGLKKELYHWHLGYGTGGVITVLFMAAYFYPTTILLSMLPVLMLPLLCNGLSLVHFMTAGYRYQFVVLFILYVCIFFILQQLLLLMLLLGYLDCFIHLRKYSVQK